MGYVWRGNFQMTEGPQNDIELDRYGVAGGTLYYWGESSQCVGFAMGITSHPLYPWLKRKSASISRSEANCSDVKISFAGVPPNTSQKTYRVTGNTSSESIDTHPRFVDDIGGKAGAALNGATFDKDGKFIGFKDATNKKYGVKSYLSGNMNYEQTWVTGNISGSNEMSDLGNISSPPNSSVKPSVGAGRTWLLATCNIEAIGAQEGDTGGKIGRVWRLSSKREWDTDIYA